MLAKACKAGPANLRSDLDFAHLLRWMGPGEIKRSFYPR